MTYSKKLLFGVSSSVLLAASQGAWGQEGENSQVNEADKDGRVVVLQRIVIGAGVKKVAIDTPQSVTVVEQRDIDEEQPTTVGDVLKRIPGVNTSGSDRVFGQTFNIRGIGAPESANEEGRIMVTVDGAVKFYEQYRMGGFFNDPELFKRVEVLRGPASSTLYGSGAIGGVINFTTKDASDFIDEGQRGAVRLKSAYNSNRDGFLGQALIAHRMNDNAEFLAMGNYRRSDSYETGDGTEVPSSNFEAWSGLAKGTFKVGEEGTLRVSYQQWDSDADDQDYAQVGTQNIFGTVDRHVIDRTAVVQYENPFADNDMADVKVSASFSNTTVDQTDASGNPMFGLTCATSQLFCDTEYGYKTWQFNAQNTSRWEGENWENFLTYGWQTAYQTRTAEAAVLPGTPAGIAFHPEGTDFKTGVFAQNEFIWDQRLTLIPGVRVDWRRLSPGDEVLDPDGDSVLDSDDTAFSPKLAAHYKFNENLALFGSVAHTERLPTLDEVFSTGGNSGPFQPSYDLSKERANNYELGFAVSSFDLIQPSDSLQIKTTGFYNDIKDLIALRNPRDSELSGYQNITAAEIYGFEVEAAYDSDYVFANLGYSHVVGKNKLTDRYLTTVAPDELSLTLGGKLPDYGLRFGWKSRFIAGPQDDALDTDVPPPSGSTRYAKSFDVHDVFASWSPQEGKLVGWTADFGIENIFDKQYKEFLHNDPAKGRTFKLTLVKQFDY